MSAHFGEINELRAKICTKMVYPPLSSPPQTYSRVFSELGCRAQASPHEDGEDGDNDNDVGDNNKDNNVLGYSLCARHCAEHFT